MISLRSVLHTTPLLLMLFAMPAAAAAVAAASDRSTTIDLAAEAEQPAANDLARAVVFAEASGATPNELAKQVNSLINNGLKTAKANSKVKTQSGATHTYPIYGKGNKIEGWRMRAELMLESTDSAALSELLGQLQATLSVANLTMLPSAETRKQAESGAIVDAIAAFKARAKLVSDTLGKSYRIKHLDINSAGQPPIRPMMRSATLAAADAAPLPIEAGETQVKATISGQIELLE